MQNAFGWACVSGMSHLHAYEWNLKGKFTQRLKWRHLLTLMSIKTCIWLSVKHNRRNIFSNGQFSRIDLSLLGDYIQQVYHSTKVFSGGWYLCVFEYIYRLWACLWLVGRYLERVCVGVYVVWLKCICVYVFREGLCGWCCMWLGWVECVYLCFNALQVLGWSGFLCCLTLV